MEPRSVLAAIIAVAVIALPAGPSGATNEAAAAPRGPAAAIHGPVRSARTTGDWAWPVAPPVLVVAPFLAPPTPYSAGHRGIDIASAVGADVVAPASGIVTFAGPVAGRAVIAIDHGDGLVSAIEPVSAAVAPGATVNAGDPLGLVATGGHCDSRCIHFGVRLHGEYVSPLLFLGGVPRAVLLPLG